MSLFFHGQWPLVFCVVSFALMAQVGYVTVILGRRGGTTWKLLCAVGFFGMIMIAAWFALLFERPDFYYAVPMWGWVILVSVTLKSFAMWALAFRVVRGDRRDD